MALRSLVLLVICASRTHGFALRFLKRTPLELQGGGVDGIEGGVVIQAGGLYGLFTTDITHGDVATRLVGFRAESRDGPFVFQNEVACCSSANRSGLDNRAALWAPMPTWNGTMWHLE